MPLSFLSCRKSAIVNSADDQSLRLVLQPYNADECALSRTVPTMLNKALSTSQWEEFCEQVESVLQKARDGRRVAWRVAALGALVILALSILGARRFNNTGGVPAALIAAFPATMLVVLCTFCFFSYRLEMRMKALCAETSSSLVLFEYEEQRAIRKDNPDDPSPEDDHVDMHYYVIIQLLSSQAGSLEEGNVQPTTIVTTTTAPNLEEEESFESEFKIPDV
eukprot:CAMPEP_0194045502 /NCGR_PEP_ID=MMETSP0009_2-20130614/16823_1 /TAXON_ID=210454 /ORGANISM="Grammatophora oceanica, Strain CCMP 410" /LENGTH=221 /DNA_ID=CAMNT_0038690367 /DNA_START=94 /DNA_END=759 /DNA_ORIENTATION=+